MAATDNTGSPSASASSTDTDDGPDGTMRARTDDAPAACSDTPCHENGTRTPSLPSWSASVATITACRVASRTAGCTPNPAGDTPASLGSDTSAKISSPRRHISGQPLERRAVPVAARRQPLVEPVDVDRGRARWWPGAQIGAGLDGAGAHDPFGVQSPSRVRVGARQYRHRAMARFVGTIDDHLHRHRTGCRDHQRRRQSQLVDDRAADLVTGADGHLDKARTREDDHAADRVIGQPALRPRREPAGQHYAARGRQVDHRAQQCVLAGRQPEALGIDRGVIGGQPETASLKGIGRQLDESGAGQRGTPVHPDARHERPGHAGHQAVGFGTVFAQQRHRRDRRPRPATPRSRR